MVNKVILNKKIVSLRKKKGLSQQELAEALDVSRQAVSRWEVGISLPSTENLLALSKLFEIPIDELTSPTELLDVPDIPEHDSEKVREGKKSSQSKGGSKRLRVVLIIVVIGEILTAIYLSQSKMKPVDQNIIKFEVLEEEKISDSNAVTSGTTS